MAYSRDTYQLVFLIDVSIFNPANEDDLLCDKILNNVKLCTLKLLTHFASKVPDHNKLKNLRWGYKFYHSVSLSISVQKYNLRDFSLKNFEEFEDLLDNTVESERVKSHGLVRHKKSDQLCDNKERTSHSQDDEEDDVDHLRKSLQELLYDYIWDMPDVSSPVKPVYTKHRRQKAEEPKQQNIVFLFSKCPKTEKSLLDFAACGEMDEDLIFRSFMPNRIYGPFYEKAKINMFWVDSSLTQFEKENSDSKDLKGISILHSLLERLGGGVIPIAALLHTGHGTNSHLHSLQGTSLLQTTDNESTNWCNNESDHASGIVYPTSTVLSFYSNIQEQNLLNQQLASNGYLVIEKENGKRTILSSVAMKPMQLERDNIQNWSAHCSSNMAAAETTTGNTVQLDISVPPEQNNDAEMVKSDQQMVAVSVTGESSESVGEGKILYQLMIRGTVCRGAVPLHCLQSQSIFVISDLPGKHNKINFSQLLVELAAQQLMLVVECTDSFTKLALTGILQPLTTTAATLTLVRSDMSLSVEKLVFFSRVHEKNWGTLAQKLFDSTTVRDAMKKFHQTTYKKSAHMKCNRNKETCGVARYSANFLESWCLPGVVPYSNTPLQDLHISHSTACDDQEGNILKGLQRHYRRLASARHTDRPSDSSATTTPSSTSNTPKKSCRKKKKVPTATLR